MDRTSKAQWKAIFLNLLSGVCGPLGIFLFVTHHPVLGAAAVLTSLGMARMAGTIRQDGAIDEAMEAKAEWDRNHPDEAQEPEEPTAQDPETPGPTTRL
ncbi:hypothetical protein KVA01_10490 [Kocuria varians]|uniref:Uncharacterized protein n=1 Tax=Kocuria varians TaxID=1272 RepID=A0A4Y4D5C9_KOCVA|nr:hypothetical protein [Kocuria varians]GEC98894.1 hypothetical protein KVA01_10490 [Kocuria varians]